LSHLRPWTQQAGCPRPGIRPTRLVLPVGQDYPQVGIVIADRPAGVGDHVVGAVLRNRVRGRPVEFRPGKWAGRMDIRTAFSI